MENQFWKRKLMAFLHDPPNKPLDIVGHKEVADACLRRAGISDEEMELFSKICDYTAAAADRFPFPRGQYLNSKFDGCGETPFRHPLGGSAMVFDKPMESANYAEERFQSCQPGNELEQLDEEEKPWANFFLHWRRWPTSAAEIDYRTMFLPADTRLPDHNVWTHNSIVSALEGCVVEGKLRPAFLLFQMGPVQAFISQARSTRDLWSGSYLLSWLIAHAIKAITDQIGPDSIIFPALRGQPLFDLLHRDRLYEKVVYTSGEDGRTETLWERLRLDKMNREILTPSLPNRFLALVPETQSESLAREAESAVHQELMRIANSCLQWFDNESLEFQDDWKERFLRQIELFPQITWQAVPWRKGGVRKLLEHFTDIDPDSGGKSDRSPSDNLNSVYRLAVESISEKHRDDRNFNDPKTDLKNTGFCWPYHYWVTDMMMAARRRFRNFEAWLTDENQFGAVKDSLSGKEEVIGGEEWWQTLRKKKPHLFRSQDRLGALNLVKRTWHLAYLEKAWNLKIKQALRFESVPAVAAGQWRNMLFSKVRDSQETWQEFLQVKTRLCEAAAELEKTEKTVASSTLPEIEWLKKTDPECFLLHTWDDEAIDREAAGTVRKTLKNFYESGISDPPTYYAVLALDGDEMGKWISGEKTPRLENQFSNSARNYFHNVAEADLQHLRRPLSPSYHLQFSEALANFGLYLTEPIIEFFGGQLIYSGGDDVLAMLPAETAFRCAEALRSAFLGDRRLEELVPGHFQVHGTEGGFVRMTGPSLKAGTPTWPLVVPGPRTDCSVGIGIGHFHAPLQGLIRAAQEAERRAKWVLGRSACSVSLFKRSGETVYWGFKWDNGAVDTFEKFMELSRGKNPQISTRFGYALRELLQPYAPPSSGGQPVVEDAANFPIRPVIERELRHVLHRQWQSANGASEREGFYELCLRYLRNLEAEEKKRKGQESSQTNAESQIRMVEDFPRLFDTANFILRGES